MDIDAVDVPGAGRVYTVKLTDNDLAMYPTVKDVLDRCTTCGELLMALAIMTLELQGRQGEFKTALRQATAEKVSEGGLLTAIYEKIERGDYSGLGAMAKELGVSVGEATVKGMGPPVGPPFVERRGIRKPDRRNDGVIRRGEDKGFDTVTGDNRRALSCGRRTDPDRRNAG